MISKPMLVHVGMHKTGTSFLQSQVFPALNDIVYSRNFNLRNYYCKNGDAYIISDELLSGNPFIDNTIDDFEMKIASIKNLFPSAIILICFREPVEYISSLYKQFLHQGGTIPFDDFFNINNTGVLKVEDLNYLRRIEFLNSHFDDIIAYDFSTFKHNPHLIYSAIGNVLNIKMPETIKRTKGSNVSINSKWQVVALKRLNKFFGFTYKRSFFRRNGLTPRNLIQNKLAFIKGDKWEIGDDKKADIRELFKHDWELTKKRLNY